MRSIALTLVISFPLNYEVDVLLLLLILLPMVGLHHGVLECMYFANCTSIQNWRIEATKRMVGGSKYSTLMLGVFSKESPALFIAMNES